MIELQNVCAGYPGREVLHDINLSIPEGEVMVLVGPNGCGKSTLLKTLVRILPHSAGRILVDGRDAESYAPNALAQKIAYLSQGKSVPDITVQRMVLHGRFPYLSYPRRYRALDYTAADAAMAQLGITDLANQPMGQLSGGMQQKVYIAMALAQDAPTIFMDEPTTYLDVSHQLQLMDIARELAGCGKTVVMVLHDLAMAMENADRMVVMDRGRMIDTGTPEAIYSRRTVDEVFGICVTRIETPGGWKYYYDRRKRG